MTGRNGVTRFWNDERGFSAICHYTAVKLTVLEEYYIVDVREGKLSYREQEQCSTPKIKKLIGAHNYLCGKSSNYHNWHHNKHHKPVHFGVFFITIITLLSLFGANYLAPVQKAHALESKVWNLSSGSYTKDANKIEISGSNAQLKQLFTPSTDWIANEGGASWSFRKPITVTNTYSWNLPDYQLEISGDLGAVFDYTQETGADIRFTDDDGVTTLPYWIKSYSASGRTSDIFVKIPLVHASETIYLYYGNANASAASNGDNTFALFDHFTGSTIDENKWPTHNGETLSNTDPGVLTLTQVSGTNTATDYIFSSASFNWNTTVEFRMKKTGTAANMIMEGLGSQDELSCDQWSNCIKISNDATYDLSSVASDMGGPDPDYLNGKPPNANWHNYKIEFEINYTQSGNGLRINVYQDDDTIGYFYNNGSSGNLVPSTAAVLAVLFRDALSVDWITVRSSWYNDPTYILGTAESIYDQNNPTVVNDTVQEYSLLSGFSVVSSGTGSIKFQISADSGTNWYWWNSALQTPAWVAAAGYSETNTAGVINSNISAFRVGNNPRSFKWKAYLHSDGDQQVQLESVTLTYTDDTLAPSNPNPVTGKDTVGGLVTLTSDNWYNYASPYFTWSEPADNADTGNGEVASGVAGYYVYFGTTTGDGAYQTALNYTGSGMTSGQTYYFKIKTVDVAGNISVQATPFVYKYDSAVPINPTYVTVSPPNFTATNEFTFNWPVGSDALSGLANYEYRIRTATGTLGEWVETDLRTVTLTDLAEEGTNVFYLRTVDVAGNKSEPISANFLFAGSFPGAPTDLQVTPGNTSSTNKASVNSFSFSWKEPDSPIVPIKQYRYSINAVPNQNLNNTTIISADPSGTTTLPAGPYATSQDDNTFYVVAEDEAGKILPANFASKVFWVQTAAPGAPTGMQIFDISNRDSEEYAVSLKWTEPVDKGAGFAGYSIYRSTNNSTFTQIGTINGNGTTFADTGVSSTRYYYHVKSRDDADQYSAASTTVSVTPTGRFTIPPALSERPTVSAKSFSATISWETDRTSSSFIEYGTRSDKLGKEKGGETVGLLDAVTKHSVTLKGLNPETPYYYQAVWVDSDGNQGRSEILAFTTGLRPVISDVKFSSITLDSATVSWQSSTIATSHVYYGKTTNYGGVVTDSSASQTTRHTINLADLNDSTTYHVQISGTDGDGNILKSDDYTFSTLIRPIILGDRVNMEPVKDAVSSSVKFTWETNVPTTSIVRYNAPKQGNFSKSSAEYVKDHEIIISDLADQTTYSYSIEGVDQFGNTVRLTPYNPTFNTPDDTRPPKIANLTVEIRASGFGKAQKAQLVVSWETDEPATSQAEYDKGITSSNYQFSSKKDASLTKSHVVIISELEPTQIYHLRAVSSDKAGNTNWSVDTTAITGKMQNSILDLILNSLTKSLGFLSKISFWRR